MTNLRIHGETLTDKGDRLADTAEIFVTNDAPLSGCGSVEVSSLAEESEQDATMLVFYFAEQTFEAGASIKNMARVWTQQDARFARVK